MRTRIICWMFWYLIVLCLFGCLVHEDIDPMHRRNNNWWSDLDIIHPVQGHAIQWFTQCRPCSFWIVKLKGWHFSKQVEYPTLPGPSFAHSRPPLPQLVFWNFEDAVIRTFLFGDKSVRDAQWKRLKPFTSHWCETPIDEFDESVGTHANIKLHANRKLYIYLYNCNWLYWFAFHIFQLGPRERHSISFWGRLL